MALPRELSTIKRFGPRYGRTTRHKLGLIESVQKQNHKCPYCLQLRVKRVAMGIWHCRKCNAQFTGKAYTTAKKKLSAQELMAQIAAQETAAKESLIEAEESTEQELEQA